MAGALNAGDGGDRGGQRGRRGRPRRKQRRIPMGSHRSPHRPRCPLHGFRWLNPIPEPLIPGAPSCALCLSSSACSSPLPVWRRRRIQSNRPGPMRNWRSSGSTRSRSSCRRSRPGSAARSATAVFGKTPRPGLASAMLSGVPRRSWARICRPGTTSCIWNSQGSDGGRPAKRCRRPDPPG